MRYVLAVGLALALTVAAAFGLENVSLGVPLITALAALFLLLLPYLLFALTDAPEAIEAWLRTRPAGVACLAAGLLAPYLLYGWGTGAFDRVALARLLVFVAVPTLLTFLGRRRAGFGWLDVVAMLAIWLPFDLHLLEGIWVWPEGQGSYGYQAVVAVDLVLLLFIPFRRIHGIGYRFRLGLGDARAVLVNFIFFAILAIPLGLGIGFLTFGSASFDLGGFLSSLLAIFVFTAVPEELLFRGLIQNLLDKRWGRGWPSLLVAAAIFGVAHLNNGDIPNWSYALMATLAGVFYGRAFRQSGFLTAPAVVHALVDAVWHAFFS